MYVFKVYVRNYECLHKRIFFLLQRPNLIRAHADIYANMHKSNLVFELFVLSMFRDSS